MVRRGGPGGITPVWGWVLLWAGGWSWFLRGGGGGGRGRWIARVCALLVALIGLSRLLQVLFGLEPGIDRILFPERLASEAASTGFTNSMAFDAALDFALIGVALLYLD